MTKLGFCGYECGWQHDQAFVCDDCQRTVCYCEGANDNLADLCNDCWAKHSCRDGDESVRCDPCCRRSDLLNAEYDARLNAAWAEAMAEMFPELMS